MTTKKVIYRYYLFREYSRSSEPDYDYLYASAVEHRDAFRFTFRHTGYT